MSFRHQTGIGILPSERGLKISSNHCWLPAASLTNAANFFWNKTKEVPVLGSRGRQKPSHWEKGVWLHAWRHVLWKLTKKICVNLLKMFRSRSATRRADMLAPHLTWGFLLHLSVTAEQRDRRQERNHWDAAFCPAPHLFPRRPCQSPSHPQC